MMRKLFAIAISLFAALPLFSQIKVSEARSNYNLASEAYLNNDFKSALDGYLQGMKAVDADSLQSPFYKEMARMVSVCYDTLDMDRENMEFLEKFMSETRFTPEEQKVFDYQYSRACHFYGSDLLFGDSSDFDAIREIFFKGLKHASGELERETNAYIGYTYYFQGAYAEMDYRYSEAVEYLKKASSYFVKGKDLEGILRSNTILADIAYAQFRFDEAMELYGLIEKRAMQGGALKSRFEALSQMQRIARELDYTDIYLETTIKIDSLILSFRDPAAIMDGKVRIAEDAMKADDLYRAEDLYLELLNLADSIPDEEARLHYGSLAVTRLRDVYRRQKDYDKAVLYAKKSIDMGIRYGMPRMDLKYLNLVGIFTDMKDRENSFRYIDSISAGYDDQTPSEILQSYHYVRGNVHAVFNECEEALKEYGIAENIARETGTEWNDIILEKDRGNMYRIMGSRSEALEHFRTYETLCIRAHGEGSFEQAYAITALAEAEGEMGDVEQGWRDCMRALDIVVDIIRHRTRFLPSDKKTAYFNKFSEQLMLIAAYPAKTGYIPEEGLSRAYDALLLVKGIQLASEKSARDLVLESGSEQDLEIYHQMNSLRGMISTLEGQPEKDLESITRLYTSLTAKDAVLAAHIARYSAISDFSDFDYSDVKANLRKNDVLVDFFDYKDWDSRTKYAAYVISGRHDAPFIVPLFDNARLDELLLERNGEISRLYEGESLSSLSEMILEPLRPYLGKTDRLFISPDGKLHGINFSALQYDDRHLLGDRMLISRLSSAREIRTRQIRKMNHPSALLYGGIVYDMTPSEMQSRSDSYEFPRTRSFRSFRFREKNAEGFGYLPYTEIEVDEIEKVLHSPARTLCLKGKEATEESFMAIDGQSPEILHFATHGFYYAEKDAEKADALSHYRDAMHLSGLVMAGANAVWKGEEKIGGVMDGLLTADEISRMDLRNTSLVTLSACNTGKGKVTSEGIFGLQRAFKKAGAQTLVVSLWEASDKATSLFMTSFYERLSKNGWKIDKAFSYARNEVRKMYPDPFYWAGFILID